MEKVLLVSTVPALESYCIGVIRAGFQNKLIDCYACIFLQGTDQCTIEEGIDRYGLSSSNRENVMFYKLAATRISRNLRSGEYLRRVVDFAHKHKIYKIHFIAQDVMLCGHLNQFREFELYYTVHDLVPHQAKLNFFQRLKHYYFRIRKDRLLTRLIDRLVTNSIHQKAALQRIYPNKAIFTHEMPGLVTPAIRAGSAEVQELRGVSGYVLFFGRIEVYKGLDRLYDDFLNRPELKTIKLVIAGRGKVYFKRFKEREENVIFLNRYIADEEVNDLIKNAKMLILPYVTATQSAVSSLSYYHLKPVIASDIEGLRDSVIHEKTGLLYNSKLPEDLCDAILRIYSDQKLENGIKKYLAEENILFDGIRISEELGAIYNYSKL